MKRLWKKVFLSVISLLLVISTLATSTYAWMSLNSEAWVEGMSFTATGGEGFLISVDSYNYKNQLSQDDLYKAVVAQYMQYDFSESGNLLDGEGNPVSKEEVERLVKTIKLEPLTSINNQLGTLPLTDLMNQEITAAHGRFYEFEIYFKRVDNSEMAKAIDIYFNGEDYYLTDTLVPHTIITSEVEEIGLDQDLDCIERDITNGDKIKYYKGEKIEVQSSNAMRLGFVYENKETIVEFPSEYDLGSYATDYDKSNRDDSEKEVLDKLYNAEHNAMYTYYNRLKGNSLKKLDYDDLPQNYYRSILDSNNENQICLCTLSSNEAARVSFKLWLEGWDADCFDGISKQISVQLSFVQKVQEEQNINK